MTPRNSAPRSFKHWQVRQASPFANLTPPGPISVIIGISAIGYCFRMPLVSFLLGAIGIIFGIVSLRDPHDERLEIWMAWLGIGLSFISIIAGLINIYVQ